MSNLKEKPNNNKTKRSQTDKNPLKNTTKTITENQLAIEETKKLYQKYYEAPNQLFISQLKTDTMNIYLSNFKLNDISVINKILGKYKYIKNLTLSPIDPFKTNSTRIRNKNSREPITEGEKVKLEKEAKDKQIEYSHMINKITLGIGKHLFQNEKLESFSLLNFQIDEKLAHNLSFGIINNKSIKSFRVNNCQMNIEAYEILLKGLFSHPKIEKLDLQNNNLKDKYGNMIGRIISRQTDRRDEVIWSFALRNEFPENKDYKNGLISINLNGNHLSSYSADCLTTALASDQYVRSIILSNNDFDLEACKKFVYMLRRNMTLLNIDLTSNKGYNDNIQKRLIIKMSKNIKNLYIKYKNNEIDEKEFEEYKKYINSSLFFKIDIPEDVVQNYNNDNFNKITEDNTNNINKNIVNKDNNKENGMVLKELKNNNNLNMNNDQDNINKDKKKSPSKSPNKPKNNSDQDTKKLIEENLSLKKQILELKAENIKNLTRKNIAIPNKYKSESLNKNFKQAEELLDKLNNLMKKMENDVEQKKETEKNNIDNTKKNVDNNKNNIDNNKSNNADNKIKIKNIVLNDKKEENNKNNLSSEKKKDKPKEKEKKEIKLNLDDNNKLTFKNEENNIKKNNIHINNNFFKDNVEKENKNNKYKNDKNKDKNNKEINNKKEEKLNNINKKNNKINLKEKDEVKESEEMENFDKDEAIMQHRIYFEQLKKEYAARGLKFEMEDYLELLQNQELEEEEEEEYDGF